MSRRIVLAGGSGFIGRYLAAAFRADGDQVSVIGRTGPDAAWGDTAAITAVLDGADLLVNLAGKSVNCRYTAGNRAEILRSRVETTRELAAAVRACVRPPRLWLNSSTATIYRHAEDRAMTESTGEIGTGFSVSIATAWEDEFFGGELPGTRRVALRMAIVLGDGSALVPLRWLAWAGLGGPQLDGPWPITRARRAAGTGHAAAARGGSQRFSWIHLDDVLGAIRFIDATPSLTGPVNLSAPEVSDNATLMRQLRWLQGRAVGLPAPRALVELGTWLLRTESELVLKSRWVLPERLLAAGYRFNQPALLPALRSIVQRPTNPPLGGLPGVPGNS
jgi:NAD dependent epimerase/dehydratase family enzyme